MRLDTASRKAKERERRLRQQQVERDDSNYQLPRYQPSAGALIDCKGGCGKVVFPFRNDGCCSGCKPISKLAD